MPKINDPFDFSGLEDYLLTASYRPCGEFYEITYTWHPATVSIVCLAQYEAEWIQ